MLLPDQHFGEDSAHSHIRHGRCNSTFQYELLERLIFRVDSIQRGSQSRAFHIDGTSSEQILGRGRRYFTITVDGDSSEVVKKIVGENGELSDGRVIDVVVANVENGEVRGRKWMMLFL